VTRKRSLIYLAGPMSGCNRDQMRDWRARVVDRWSSQFDFINPVDDLDEEGDASPHGLVRKDEEAILRSDAMLANMWRESIGTAIGVAHAHYRGKPVVVVDPNRLNNRLLAYYAAAVVDTPHAGMKALRSMLRQQERIREVIKREGRREPFDRGKLTESIREACRAAGRNDILVPAEVLPIVLERLTDSARVIAGGVSAGVVRDAVWQVLADLEADPLRHRDYAGIREAWERHDRRRRSLTRPAALAEPAVRARSLRVRVFSAKSHATIWGKTVKTTGDIPQPARQAFREICRVEGIAEVRLTTMSQGPHVDGVRIQIHASRQLGIIEGKCHHQADKGDVQAFQIRVHDPEATEAVRRRLVSHLAEAGLARLPGGAA